MFVTMFPRDVISLTNSDFLYDILMFLSLIFFEYFFVDVPVLVYDEAMKNFIIQVDFCLYEVGKDCFYKPFELSICSFDIHGHRQIVVQSKFTDESCELDWPKLFRYLIR